MDLPIEDADRDRVIAGLRAQHAAGQLDAGELNRRVEIALNTADHDELDALTDGPPPLSSMNWTPNPNRQVAPYTAGDAYYPPVNPRRTSRRAMRRERAWQPSVMWIVSLVVLAVVTIVVLRSGGFFWALILLFPLWRNVSRMRGRGSVNPPHLPPPPRGVQDRFDADGGSTAS